MKLIAACAFGLERPVVWELERMGCVPSVAAPGRVEFEGDWNTVCQANLWLRVADRVLIEIARFPAADFEALFETTRNIDWRAWLPANAAFPVTARTRGSKLTSLPAIQRSCKKAIVESLLAGHQTSSLPEDGPLYRIEAALLDDTAVLTIDTTGASLHKRGYRSAFVEAPIKETLAAAMIMLSVWNSQRPLIDPFCGSGTIPIEAALIARNIAPGLRREFDWQHWPQIERKVATAAREEAIAAAVNDGELQIMGTDQDPRAVEAARQNALNAGVADDIHFQVKRFEDLRSKREYGCVITNPPYGERLGETRHLLPLYESFPAVLQRLPTWSHFIITSFPAFEGLLRKSATRRRKLFNGRIECMFYQFLGPRPESAETHGHTDLPEGESSDQLQPPAALDQPAADERDRRPRPVQPVFGGLGAKDHEQAKLFATRLAKRARHLRRWPARRGIHCYRIYERDVPELPFVVDRYEDWFHVSEFDRPHDRDPGHHAAWLELMQKTIAATFEVHVSQVYFKSRRQLSGPLQHERGSEPVRRLTVREGDLKFLVNPTDHVDTGLFLDQRILRSMIRDLAEGRRFLNLFGYTGTFSVYAAAGGATSTTTVDWSQTSLDWARENMRLNSFTGANHQFIRGDSLEFPGSPQTGKPFDLVVVAPPSFSNSARGEKVWDVQRDHVELLKRLARSVVPGGLVFFLTTFRTFKFDPTQLPEFSAVEISAQTVPEDFRNRRIHRCWRLART